MFNRCGIRSSGVYHSGVEIKDIMTSSLLSKCARHPAWLVAFVALIVLMFFAGASLARRHWDPMACVDEGTFFRDGDPNRNAGYDGQFAYYIPDDPLQADARLDAPAYRYLHILYPLLAWLLSLGGQEALIPWVLIGINLVALSVVTAWLGELLVLHGAGRWYGMAVPLFAGMLFALRQDLNEPLALAPALGALVALPSDPICHAFRTLCSQRCGCRLV